MASINAKVQFRLTRMGRFTLKAATFGRRYGFAIPHGLVKAITNRSWQMRLGDGDWKSIRMAPGGQVIA